MDIHWPSYDDDDGPDFDEDEDPGDLYQFTPDEISTITDRGHNNPVLRCGIVVQGETDPRRIRFLEQALQDGQPSSASSSSKDSPLPPPLFFRLLRGNVR